MEHPPAEGQIIQLANEMLTVVVDREHGHLTAATAGDPVPLMLIGPSAAHATIGGREFALQGFDEPEVHSPIAPGLGAAEHLVFQSPDGTSGAVLRLHVQLQQDQPLALVWLEVLNPTAQPLLIERLSPLRTVHQGAVAFAAPAERLRVFVDNGSLCGSGSRPLSGVDLDHVAHGALVVADPEAGWAASCSFASFQIATVANHIATGRSGLPELLEARCDYPNGYRLTPGESLRSEVVALGFYERPQTGTAGHAALEQWADVVMAVGDLQPPRPARSGWNSWYCYRLTITEDIVLDNARVIRDKLSGLGLENIQIDHGWQHRDIVGKWVVNDRFPHGLPWLAEQLKEMGFSLGLWTAVTQVSEFAPLFQEHPEAMFQTPEGEPKVTVEHWHWEPHGRTFTLDPTHPVGEAFYREAGEAIRDSGCVYWKNDFQANLLQTEAVLHDREATTGVPIYLKGVRAYREGVGPGVAQMACNAALNPIAGLCDAAWTHADIGNPGGRWDWLRAFMRDHFSRYHVSGKFYWSDPDYLQVGQGTAQENRVRMAIMVFGGGPMFLSDRLPELPDEKIELIKQCLPGYGPAARPLDLLSCPEYPQVLHLPVTTAWGSWDLLGLFNLSEQPGQVAVNLAELGLSPGREVLVYDYFRRRLIGRVRPADGAELLLRVPLPATDVAVLRLTPVEDRPFVIGTDLHLAQGAVELQQVRWDADELVLSGEATRPPGTSGHVYIHVPEAYEPCDGVMDEQRILAVPLSFAEPVCRWSAGFRLTENQGR